MMNALYFKGKIAGIKITEYDGQKTFRLQFLQHGDNGIEMTTVKVHEDDKNRYEEGQEVTLPVTASSSANTRDIYYKTIPHNQQSK